jgi:hypothetical protein
LLARHTETAACREDARRLCFEPIGTVYCGYPPQVALPFPMLGLDDRRPGRSVSGSSIAAALCGTAGVMAFVLSGHGAWEQLDNAALAAALQRELAATLHARCHRCSGSR